MIGRWRSEFGSPEQRLIAALRFVQDDVRYLGIELGRYSHQPTPPLKVFARRFGDCKDKSLLLSTLLSALGIDAFPALVNAKTGKALDSWQPSPFAFNHVIVKAMIGGRTYWLDPTISFQRGGLDQYYDPPYARALVLRDGSKELEQISPPTSQSGRTTIAERYTVTDYASPVAYSLTTTYRGADADDFRYQLSRQSLAELGKSFLNYYADALPSIRGDGLPQVKDDQSANILVVNERYLVDDFWKEGKHLFRADRVSDELHKPNVSRRSQPLEVTYPLAIFQTIEINMPDVYDAPADSGAISDGALRFNYRQSQAGNTLKLEYSLETLDDHVSGDQVAKHLAVLDQIRKSLGFELSRGMRTRGLGSSISRSRPGLSAIAGFLALPLVVVLSVLGLRARSRRRHQSRSPQKVMPRVGNAPETAIQVRTQADMVAYLLKKGVLEKSAVRRFVLDLSPPK